jgi:hypothetical protein
MTKQIPLDELQERARQMTLRTLESYVVPDDVRSKLTLGVQFDGEIRVFELYVPGDRPVDAWVISRARLNVHSGEGTVEVLGLEKKQT